MLKRASHGHPGTPRCALALGLKRELDTAYLIEIECRETESYKTVFVSGYGLDDQIIITGLIDTVAYAEGKNLDPKLNSLVASLGLKSGACYRHSYIRGDEVKLDPESLAKFFLTNWN
jgi:hypothetical protein